MITTGIVNRSLAVRFRAVVRCSIRDGQAISLLWGALEQIFVVSVITGCLAEIVMHHCIRVSALNLSTPLFSDICNFAGSKCFPPVCIRHCEYAV